MTSSVSVGGEVVPLSEAIRGVVGSVVVGRLGVSAMVMCRVAMTEDLCRCNNSVCLIVYGPRLARHALNWSSMELLLSDDHVSEDLIASFILNGYQIILDGQELITGARN